MSLTQISQAVIGSTAPVLEGHYTHSELNALFMQAGFPGDPPEGNKLQKCLTWMRRANAESPEPLKMFGRLIADLMDTEPNDFLTEKWKANDPRDRIITSLSKDGLSYQRGGYIVGNELKEPSRSLEERLKQDGMTAVETEYRRAYETINTDPGAAITAACAIVEAVCKHYLRTEGIPLPSKQTISPLWTEVARNLGLSPGQAANDDVRQILSGLFSIASGVGALRTHEGSAHGHEEKDYKVDTRYARLAVHAAHTMSLFILETWEARGRKR